MRAVSIGPAQPAGDYRKAAVTFDDNGERVKWLYIGGLAEKIGRPMREVLAYRVAKLVLEVRRDSAHEAGIDPKSLRATDPEQDAIMDQIKALDPAAVFGIA